VRFLIDKGFKGAKNTYNNIILILKDLIEEIPINQLPLQDFYSLTKFLLNHLDGNLRKKGM